MTKAVCIRSIRIVPNTPILAESDDPWYVAEKKAKDSAKSDRRKDAMDPMNDMKRYLGAKKKCVEPLPKVFFITMSSFAHMLIVCTETHNSEEHGEPFKTFQITFGFAQETET